jgi:hypothetical protein
LQFAVITLLVLMFLLTPLATPGLMRVRAGAESLHVWLPPVWFLGLSETLHGKATPAFQALGAIAVRVFSVVLFVAALSYAAAYRRYFLKSAETPEIAGSVRSLPRWMWGTLDRILLRSPFDRGCFRFAAKTLFRSDRHNGVLAAFLGVGAALAVQACVLPGRDPGHLGVTAFTLSGLLTLVFFLVTGLRISFGIAQEERANWMFQVAVSDAAPDARAVVRKFILGGVMLLALASVPIYTMLAGPAVACFHALFAIANALLLTEIVLLDFCTIPFTCTYVPAQNNLLFGIVVFGVAFLLFAHGGADLEYWLLRHPIGMIFYGAVLAAALFAIRHVRDNNQVLEFEHKPDSLQLLRLSE